MASTIWLILRCTLSPLLLNTSKIHFLKWVLEVHNAQESTQCRNMGETGRYPLIHESECIELTYKFLKRTKNLIDGSLVLVAMKKQ